MKRSAVKVALAVVVVLSLLAVGCRKEISQPTPEKEGLDLALARSRMVETQIKARGIKDEKVLRAMLEVERHKFVPKGLGGMAHLDQPLPIGEGQTISQPYIVALMTECLGLKGGERVLEIGTGSGYQAAVLAEIAGQVYTIEIVESLAKRAERTLRNSGYTNITVKCGDGYLGWEEHAPFDGVMVTCAPGHIPQPLIDQLAEGGKMVIPVGTYYQELKLLEKRDGKIMERSVVPVRFVPMTGKGVKKGR